MKGSFLKKFIPVVFLVSVALFVYIMVLNEIKNLSKVKITKTEILNEKKNKIELNSVEVQKLSSEERITKIAADSLKMIHVQEQIETISVSKNQINQIEKIVNEKYD